MPAGLACCTTTTKKKEKKSFISNAKLRLKYIRFELNLNRYKTDFQQGSRGGGVGEKNSKHCLYLDKCDGSAILGHAGPWQQALVLVAAVSNPASSKA
jgi:hypothetical protein